MKAVFAQVAALGLGVVLALAVVLPLLRHHRAAPVIPPGEVAAGRQVYSRYCASCHGVHLEGQAHWDRPGEGGYFPAPPHDASGHTWEHSDKELHELIANSVYAYTAPGYRSHMPAFAGTLSDAEIDSVIAYIKSTWPASLQAYQRVLNPAGIDFKDLPPGWKFPPTCRFHARS